MAYDKLSVFPSFMFRSFFPLFLCIRNQNYLLTDIIANAIAGLLDGIKVLNIRFHVYHIAIPKILSFRIVRKILETLDHKNRERASLLVL